MGVTPDRGLAPGAEGGLQGGVPGAPAGGADRAGGDDQRSDRLAADTDDAAGTGHAGIAGGHAVHRDRTGGAGRVPELQAQAVRGAGAQGDVGGIHEAGHDQPSGRTDPTAKRG